MKPYLELMQRILDEGVEKKDRTGTGTISIFGAQMRFDLSKGFPLATTKKCHLRSIVHELLWFLNGDTNNRYLTDNGVSIWDEWCATEDIVDCTGTMGAVCRWIDCHASAELRNIISRHQSYRKAMQSALSEYMASQKPTPLEMPKTTNADDWIAFVDSLNIGCVAKDIIVYSKRIGDFGPIYGKQWRDWVGPNDEHHDQIANVLRQLREDPDSRRIIISAWNVADLDKMALPPCHAFMQFYTRELTYDERMQWFYDNMSVKYAKGEAILENAVADVRLTTAEQIMEANNVPKRVLSLQLYARSQDYFLGTPFNIASYALLVHWIARCVGMAVGEFVWTGGDIHLYSNHIDQAREQLSRQPRNLPRFIWVSPTVPADPKDIKPTDFDIIGYDPHPGIKAPIAI